MAVRELLLGDEAVALGAIHAGISGAYGYPGTPSTEMFEYIEPLSEQWGIHAIWSANEKVAYEEALGMSFAGKRAIVSMKHVGLNVAADAFVNSGVTGVRGGLVLMVADDPGMHSSQNEQDSRFYAKFALVPCYEPSNQQECYDMVREAFDVSESTGLPVVMRLVTRLAHSRADVQVCEPRKQNALNPADDPAQFTLLPANARRSYAKLTAKQDELNKQSDDSQFNTLALDGRDKKIGIIANGVACNYVREAFGGKVPYAMLSIRRYPMPMGLLTKLIDSVDEVYIVEEGQPIIEELILGVKGIGKPVHGRFDGTVPRTGEMTPAIASKVFGFAKAEGVKSTLGAIPGRPPKLCPGCSHADSYMLMKDALEPYSVKRAFSDIGCYTLGAYEPFDGIHSCVDMGASITMAAGAAHAGLFPVLCTIGDSTFIHSGMTGLIGAVRGNVNMNVLILDNGTVAMTGTQQTMATGDDMYNVIRGLGVPEEHIKVIVPVKSKYEENLATLRGEIEYKGLSVIIARRACVQAVRKVPKKAVNS